MNSEPVFDFKSVFVDRSQMQSFCDKEYLWNNLIDAWAVVLNEKEKSNEVAPRRLFFTNTEFVSTHFNFHTVLNKHIMLYPILTKNLNKYMQNILCKNDDPTKKFTVPQRQKRFRDTVDYNLNEYGIKNIDDYDLVSIF